jgi:hypothetical protein
MSLKRIFWCLLAGLSISSAGCSGGKKPAEEPKPSPNEPVDTTPVAQEDTWEAGDVEEETVYEGNQPGPTPAPMYGAPVVMYGPPSQFK